MAPPPPARLEALLLVSIIAALVACKNLAGEKAEKETPATASATPTAAPPPPPTPDPAPEPKREELADEGPVPSIPEGRSKPPTVAEWSEANEVNTQGPNSQPDKCFMKIVREWLKVNCSGDITEVTDLDGFGNENADFFQSIRPGKSADFVVRLRKGKTMKVRIHRGKEDHGASLFVNWPASKDRPVHVALGKLAK